jgi:hypothetical protein
VLRHFLLFFCGGFFAGLLTAQKRKKAKTQKRKKRKTKKREKKKRKKEKKKRKKKKEKKKKRGVEGRNRTYGLSVKSRALGPPELHRLLCNQGPRKSAYKNLLFSFFIFYYYIKRI